MRQLWNQLLNQSQQQLLLLLLLLNPNQFQNQLLYQSQMPLSLLTLQLQNQLLNQSRRPQSLLLPPSRNQLQNQSQSQQPLLLLLSLSPSSNQSQNQVRGASSCGRPNSRCRGSSLSCPSTKRPSSSPRGHWGGYRARSGRADTCYRGRERLQLPLAEGGRTIDLDVDK